MKTRSYALVCEAIVTWAFAVRFACSTSVALTSMSGNFFLKRGISASIVRPQRCPDDVRTLTVPESELRLLRTRRLVPANADGATASPTPATPASTNLRRERRPDMDCWGSVMLTSRFVPRDGVLPSPGLTRPPVHVPDASRVYEHVSKMSI